MGQPAQPLPLERKDEAESNARQPIEKPPEVRDAEDEQASPAWDIVDEASWESFPASDPPAYVHGVARGEAV